MNRHAGARLIELLRGDAKLRGSFVRVAIGDGHTDFFDLVTHSRPHGSIAVAAHKVLTETFRGAFRIWHSSSKFFRIE